MQVGVVVDPAAERIGRIRASDASVPAVPAAPAMISPGSPIQCTLPKRTMHPRTSLNQRLATFVPVAFKAIDKLKLRRDLRGKPAGVLKRQAMRRQVALDNLHFAVGVHAGGQGEVVSRDHNAAAGGGSSADVVLKRGMAIRKRGVGVTIDQRASGHGGSFAFGESASL